MQEVLKRDNFDNIKTFNFKNDNDIVDYKKHIYDIISIIVNFLYENNIKYDYNMLNDRIKNLSLYCYEEVQFSYNNQKNIMRVSVCNQDKKRFSNLDKRVILTHELLHFFAFSGVAKQFGFEECFTEYLTYLIISNYSKELEHYYIDNYHGYFNELDFNFMKHLTEKVDFNLLLDAYFKRKREIIDMLIGSDTLSYINDYFHYFWELYKRTGKPKKELNRLLVQNPEYLSKFKKINEYASKINESIDNYTHSIHLVRK